MFCPNCGEKLDDAAVFCSNCGTSITKANATKKAETPIIKGTAPTPMIPSSQINTENAEKKVDKKNYATTLFVEPDEKVQAELGDGWLVNLLYGKTKKCNAVLTDKRLYLQGKVYYGDGSIKGLKSGTSEHVLDVRYITGTFFEYSQQVGLKILGILVLLATLIWTIWSIRASWETLGFFVVSGGLVASLLLEVAYVKTRKAFFRVEFGYGYTKSVRINASILGIEHVKDFERQVIRVKDKARDEWEHKFAQRVE